MFSENANFQNCVNQPFLKIQEMRCFPIQSIMKIPDVNFSLNEHVFRENLSPKINNFTFSRKPVPQIQTDFTFCNTSLNHG